MPIPEGHTAFTWTRAQASKLVVATERLKVFYSEWASLTGAQKTGLKNQAVAVLDSVVAELTDIRSSITGL